VRGGHLVDRPEAFGGELDEQSAAVFGIGDALDQSCAL
jgi:hypothetical protein